MPQLPVLNNLSKQTLQGATGGGVSGVGGEVAPELAALAGELSARAGEGGEVRFGAHDRALYSTDASLYQVRPLGVVVPGSTSDAERVVRFAVDRGVPILPRGGGTSLAGQCTNRAVVLDLTPRCRRVLGVDVAAKTCVVEPGIGVDELNDQLAKWGGAGAGLFFAPDPATTRQAAIGGCLGNNAAGARSIRYGRTSENVHRLDVCLGTGERLWLGPNAGRDNATARRLGEGVLRVARAHAAAIRERFPRTVRRNAGYGLDMILDQADAGATAETVDLAKLLCGSEGTLAVTLGAELKLHPTPMAKGLAVVSFRTLEDSIAAVKPILDACLPLGLTAVELLDDVVLDAARGNTECRKYVDLLPGADAAKGEPKAALYVEFFGFGGAARDEAIAKAEVEQGFAALRSVVGRSAGVLNNGVAAYTDSGAMLKAWALRKAGEPLLHGLPGARKPITFVEDNAVPVERLGEFVREFKRIVARHGTRAAYWAHASVGVLHVRPMIDLHDPSDRERMRAIAVEVADLARACGGIMSGEHGDGRVRGPLIERFFGPELMQAFREVKALFDPKGLLNPGNIVDPGPVENITANLRVDAGGATSSHHGDGAHAASGVKTFYDYADNDGFGHAVEQCNGAGVCRKRGGVMCPSYQATLDERHSTRGRGNALRLAVTGQFSELPGVDARRGEPNWNDEETIRTLDLCLSCKGCKSECPSNVDIAKLKAEYTAQSFAVTGRIPLNALATGHVRMLNRAGSVAPDLANWIGSTRLARFMINRVMKIDHRRGLPPFTRSLYSTVKRGAAVVGQSSHATATPEVAVFADCFTTYNDGQIGMAAVRVLEKLGYRVHLAPKSEQGLCCGRSMISVGMLEQAIRTIDHCAEHLAGLMQEGRIKALVVVEPSCLSAIRDDWLGLKCRTPLETRKKLAAIAMLPEEFVERYKEEHPDKARLHKAAALTGPSVLLHGHCHQKALWGVESSAKLLRQLLGTRLKVLETGCCGMAGSFGYAQGKYELSMAIGELALLPAVKAAEPGAIVLAPGTSCRHQVHDGAGRRALHPIELVEQLMDAVR